MFVLRNEPTLLICESSHPASLPYVYWVADRRLPVYQMDSPYPLVRSDLLTVASNSLINLWTAGTQFWCKVHCIRVGSDLTVSVMVPPVREMFRNEQSLECLPHQTGYIMEQLALSSSLHEFFLFCFAGAETRHGSWPPPWHILWRFRKSEFLRSGLVTPTSNP